MIIFICGIPASGKSSFGEYLSDRHDYFFIDMEHDWPDENLHNIWSTIFSPNKDELDVKRFVDAIAAKSKNTVLDLGFPVNDTYFWIVPLLKRYGCSIVWFECEENIARKRYLARDNRPIEWFETQMQNIKNNWGTIQSIIDSIVINVLKENSTNKTQEELFNELVKLGVINYV